jgi:hypothetical protein
MADVHISNCVNIFQRYCISLKNTYSADRMRPMPTLKTIIQIRGYISIKYLPVMGTPSKITNMINIISVMPKLINEDTFLEKRNMYLGTFIFVNIPALSKSDDIPRLVASAKYENTNWPAKRYITK